MTTFFYDNSNDIKDSLTLVKDNAMDTYSTNPTDGERRPWFASYERYNINANIQMPAADSSLLEMFEASFEQFADQTAYICEQQRLSYQQLNRLSQNIAAHLQTMGLKQGDGVGVMLPNLLHYPLIALGVIRAGLTLVSFNPNYTARELAYQMKDSGIRILVIMDKFVSTFEQLDASVTQQLEHVVICRQNDICLGLVANFFLKTTQWLSSAKFYPTNAYHSPKLTWHAFNQLLKTPKAPYQRPRLELKDKLLLQYTGGTTGVAKGAILTHGNLMANLLQIDNLLRSAYEEEGQGDIILTALPLYHVFTFTIGCMLVIFRGFTGLLIFNPRDIHRLIAQMYDYPPSYILGVNPLFNGLLKQSAFKQLDFSRLKATIGGGMPISPHIAKRWHETTGMPIIEGYGLSETSPVVTFNPLTVAEFTNKIGIPAPATDVLLIDEEDRPVAVGERGEIVIKGPQVMQGYQNPNDTIEVFTKNGYLRSGDIAIMDERGFIKIVDRKKDMMLVSGFNVYPAEIESVMLEHPNVVECAAIGVPSVTRGEEPKIFVVSNNPKLTEAELIEYGKIHLTAYKRPRHVVFVSSLPKSAVGKVLRRELRKREGLE